jgi:FtsP/CotA-like multicopper oxidase with cupredoxin domain
MPDITTATPGSITYLTEFDPTLTGSTVMHCHILTHEDLGMMQLIDILE